MMRWSALLVSLALVGCSPAEPTPLEEARTHLAEGHWADAIVACHRVLNFDDENPEALLIRGQSYLALHQTERAVRDFSELIRIKPEDAEGYHQRAIAYSDLGDVEGAYTDRQRARELDVTLKSAYPFELSTASPIDITPRGSTVVAAEEGRSVEDDEEEQQSFPGYGSEPNDGGFDQSRELESFGSSPGRSRQDRTRRKRSRRGVASTPFRTELPDISSERSESAADGDRRGKKDLFRQWVTQRIKPAPRPIDPPDDIPPAARKSPDVPLAEPSESPPRPPITTALPIGLDGRPVVQGKSIGTPNLSLPGTTGLTTAPQDAGSARSAVDLRNFRRPANASLKAGAFHANPIYRPTRSMGGHSSGPTVGPSGPTVGPDKPVISTAIDPNRVAPPLPRVTTGIHSRSVDPE